MFHRESGKLTDALEAMFEGLPHYSRATNGNANGAEYCMKAEWYFYRGDYENALISGHQGLHRAESQKQVTNMICVLFLMLRIALMKGEYVNLNIPPDG